MRTEAVNKALERTLSRERLASYLGAVGGNLDAAIGLYERNTLISAAFYTPLQAVEICLRNALNDRMTERYKAGWFSNGNARLAPQQRRMVDDAYEVLARHHESVSDGQMVAELKYAFWVGLLGPGYDNTLWRQALYKAFPAGGGKRRSIVHGRFNAIRRFRNRVAHHEPVVTRPLEQIHQEIIEAIGWICPYTQAWAVHQSRVLSVLNTS